MSTAAKVAYFEEIAGSWDHWHDLPGVAVTLAAGLAELGVGRDEVVLDVGSGTGNLTAALLAHLQAPGRVLAVDISPHMVEVARRKLSDERVTWLLACVEALPVASAACDRAICLSVWPHVEDPAAAAAELARVVRPGGWVHVWHVLGRHEVNNIHAGAAGPIREDVLLPAAHTAALFERCGFHVTAAIDVPGRYLVSAVSPGAGRQ